MKRRSWFEVAFDEAYLQVYAHRDEREAERATSHIVEPLGLNRRWVLDLACGAGRYSELLAGRGARVVGVDLSMHLLHSAQQRGAANVVWVRADMSQPPFANDSFDLVVSMFTSFGYFESIEQDQEMLAGVARVLRPAGSFVLDFLNAIRLRKTLVAENQRRTAEYEVHERRRIDEQRNVVVKEIELRGNDQRRYYREQVRLWDEQTLPKELERAGIRVVSRYGDYGAEPFVAEHSPRLILVGRKD